MTASEAAVVTGASSGIGEAVALALLERGLTVVTLQRSAPRIKHPNLHFRPIDLTDLEATKLLGQQLAAEFPVRYLVNNAGANRPALLEDATIDDFQYVTAVTLGAAMVLMQASVPGMRAAKFGRIVSISSRAILGKTYRTVYASAKAGLVGMARTVAIEVGGDGITVNVVVPGPVASELFNRGDPEGSPSARPSLTAFWSSALVRRRISRAPSCFSSTATAALSPGRHCSFAAERA